MKFLVIALDFDRMIAQQDVLDPKVREAIAELRGKGIVVILVTGRILADLRRVCGDLHFVDAVVAENGAFIEFPQQVIRWLYQSRGRQCCWTNCRAPVS